MQIILPHTNTDLDALGSAVGARLLYPEAKIVLPGTVGPQVTEFLSLHRYALRTLTWRDVPASEVTRAIVVDTADRDRLGAFQSLPPGVEIHLFDHHPPEPDDLSGSLEVRAATGAAATLFAELLEEAGVEPTPFEATAMLLGIYADTGSLSLGSTTDRDARAAAFLLAHGANLRVVSRFSKSPLTVDQQELLDAWRSSSRTIEVRGSKIALLTASVPGYVGGVAIIVQLLQEILTAHAVIGIVGMGKKVHLIGRSEVPWVDVGHLCAAFGGGGHAAAASAVVKGRALDEVVSQVEALLQGGVGPCPTAADLMSHPVKMVQIDQTAEQARRLMLRYGHSGLPVADPEGRLAGMISLRDVEKAERHGLVHAPVKGLMAPRVVTVTPETPLDRVQELMLEKDIGRVPVVEGERIVGILSRTDLLGLLYGGPAPRWHQMLYRPGKQSDPESREALERLAQMDASLQEFLHQAGAVAGSAGQRAYLVGGFVRDLLLGRPNLDLDLVVEGDGQRFARRLAGALGARVEPVERFGTAHIYLESAASGSTLPEAEGGAGSVGLTAQGLPDRIDVATARREYYAHPGALPEVEGAALHEDLYRRDFTFNALAIRLGPQGPEALVDFFGGAADLAHGLVRILHSLSFVEDPTRILRAVRFAHRYDFRLEPETEACARRAIEEGFLVRVSGQRIRQELYLLLREERSGTALRRLDALGALQALFPGITVPVDALDDDPFFVDQPEPWLAKLAILLSELPAEDGLKALTFLRLRREEHEPIARALAEWRTAAEALDGGSPSQVVALLAGWSPAGLALLRTKGLCDIIDLYTREWRSVRLAITGDDLLALGLPRGRRIGEILEAVLAERLEGRAPDRASQLAVAARLAQLEGGRSCSI
jgi:tRNA nucleotidyltransferase (CCA-adding enzyme)